MFRFARTTHGELWISLLATGATVAGALSSERTIRLSSLDPAGAASRQRAGRALLKEGDVLTWDAGLRVQHEDGRCLNFLHIPKAAGTSVEETLRVQVTSEKATATGGGGWGRQDTKLQCKNTTRSRCVVPDERGVDRFCPVWHTPPGWDSRLASAYSGCTTFCIVRNPVRRAVSEATYKEVNCTTEALDAWLSDRLRRSWKAHPMSGDCHNLPQYEFVYSGMTFETEEGQSWTPGKAGSYCQRVLRYETLQQDFLDLMLEFDLPFQMLQSEKNRVRCRARPSKENVELIKSLYQADYNSFGYSD